MTNEPDMSDEIERLAKGLSEADIMEAMAQRLEKYQAEGVSPGPRAARMCPTCPFRGADQAYRKECSLIPAQDWPCHTDEGEHCAGHAAALRRYGEPTPARLRAHLQEQGEG